jgi:hypothetical protein
MLPKAQGLDIDFHELRREMLRRKESLLANGFPVAVQDSPTKATPKKPVRTKSRARA